MSREPGRRRRERGRGERILPGVWRLRLPLPWPGVPHGNAYALAAGEQVVLVDTGIHEPATAEHPSSWSELERALDMVGLAVEQVGLVICTHAHADHYGQAAPICGAAGCELWMHPDHRHATAMAADPERALHRRMEVALHSGVPEAAVRAYRDSPRALTSGIAAPRPPDRELTDGVRVATDVGEWVAVQTPGHAPSHVCLHQPERGLLLSGDHLVGRVTLYFDYGWTPDPVGEFLASLDRVERLEARLCLSGHGRPFRDVAAHIEANRAAVAEQLGDVRDRLSAEPRTAYELLPDVSDPRMTAWLLTLRLSFLAHLRARGEVRSVEGEDGRERWVAA